MGDDIGRLRNDLDVMQQAMGGTLPFSKRDVWLNLLLAGAGVIMIGLALALPLRMIRWSLLPLVLGATPAVAAIRRKNATGSLDAARRREYRLGWLTAAVFVLVVIPYLLWERHLGEPAHRTAGGACVLFAGVSCALIAMNNPARRYFLGYALPLIAWGLVMQNQSLRPLVVGGGIVCVFAELSVAAIQSWQLQAREHG